MVTSLLIHPDELTKTWIDRMADAGVSVLGIHPVGGRNAVQSLAELLELTKSQQFRALIDYTCDRGLQIEYEFHAAGYLLPRELFQQHPEYFRVNADGVRTPDWNFCVSNEAAMQIVAERAMTVIKSLYRSRPWYYLWMDDRRGSRCRCERCRSFSSSDQQVLVLNRIAKELRQWKPEAKLAYLAYVDNVVPPTVQPEENLFLEYAPFEKYVATCPDREEKIRIEQESLQGLMEVFGKQDMKVLEYWYDNSMFSKWTKPPKEFKLDEAAMIRDITAYKALGAQQIASFACYLGPDYEALYEPVDIRAYTRANRLEKSCGAVVFTRVNGEIKYVLVQSKERIYGFPKGHMEGTETEQETALREIKEETGLSVSLIEGFRTEDTHPFVSGGCEKLKHIVYFLAEYCDQTPVAQETELCGVSLMDYEQAMSAFQFESSKRILTEAHSFLTD